MKDIANYLYEIGQLKRVKRSGWWLAGISDPESVAEHAFRTALIGYVLASLEGADPMKTAMMCLFHDTQEARVNDLHRLAQRYLEVGKGEELARSEQLKRLPKLIAEDITLLMHDYERRNSREAQLAHEADLIECVVQAREYQTQGYTEVQEWIDDCQSGLRSEAAKSIAQACVSVEPNEWWQGLKRMRAFPNS